LRRLIIFSGCALELEHPSGWDDDLALLFGDSSCPSPVPSCKVAVHRTGENTYSIFEDDLLSFADLPRADALHRLAGIVVGLLAAKVSSGISVHAGIVCLN
jgi:hypothetical protein